MGYSKAPEQPQSSARPMCHSHTMTNTGREPATIRIAAYRSSPRYALRHVFDTNANPLQLYHSPRAKILAFNNNNDNDNNKNYL